MALDADELARRIVSARELRGIDQAELGEAMKDEGYGKHDIAKMERQDATAPPLNRGRRIALAEILRVPEWWFTADDDEMFDRPEPEQGTRDLITQYARERNIQNEDILSRLDDALEILANHLLPYLAEQIATPADDLLDAPPDVTRSRPSSRRRRAGDSKDSPG